MTPVLRQHIAVFPWLFLAGVLLILAGLQTANPGASRRPSWPQFLKLQSKGQEVPQRRQRLESQLERGPAVYKGPWLQSSDFVVAIPGSEAQELLFAAARISRQGVRTLFATNYKPRPRFGYPAIANETWLFYPDDSPQRSWYAGDSRAALAPFLAYKHAPDKKFKWLFYGDDDTLFFFDAARALVQDYDPELPYFLTDNLWYSEYWGGGFHPHPRAPRCLPCHSSVSSSLLPMPMIRGCPCKPEQLCRAVGSDRWDVKGCRDHATTYAMHGGAGALISIGLLKQIKFDEIEACVLRQHDTGGDAFLSTCLWEQGIGLTTPDLFAIPALPKGFTAFDPNPSSLHPDDFTINKAAMVLGPMLLKAAGFCNGTCQAIVENTVSLHLRGRRTGGSQQGTAAFLRAFARLSKWDGRRVGSQEAKHDVLDAISQALADATDDVIGNAVLQAAQLAQIFQASVSRSSVLDSFPDSLLLQAVRPAADRALLEIQQKIDFFTKSKPLSESCRPPKNF